MHYTQLMLVTLGSLLVLLLPLPYDNNDNNDNNNNNNIHTTFIITFIAPYCTVLFVAPWECWPNP